MLMAIVKEEKKVESYVALENLPGQAGAKCGKRGEEL